MANEKGSGALHRALDWKGAFWVAAGVPPLVLFSIGGIAGVAGKAAFVVWMLSMVMGFLQSFTYAEMAGMFGNKSGGASVYGATAWLRYSKLIAPLSVWCNWFAWSPVLSLGCAIAAGYILNALFAIPAADSAAVLDDAPTDPRYCPTFWDFAYFATAVGMAFAVSDVEVTQGGIRRIVTLHGIAAFFYNLIVLAFTINVTAGS